MKCKFMKSPHFTNKGGRNLTPITNEIQDAGRQDEEIEKHFARLPAFGGNLRATARIRIIRMPRMIDLHAAGDVREGWCDFRAASTAKLSISAETSCANCCGYACESASRQWLHLHQTRSRTPPLLLGFILGPKMEENVADRFCYRDD